MGGKGVNKIFAKKIREFFASCHMEKGFTTRWGKNDPTFSATLYLEVEWKMTVILTARCQKKRRVIFRKRGVPGVPKKCPLAR